MKPDVSYYRSTDCTYTKYLFRGRLHREDGAAYIIEYDDGTKMEAWYYLNKPHRYGGPAATYRNGMTSYYVHGKGVTSIVHKWLKEQKYVWEKMSDIEKWELELFMRSL